MIGQLNLNAFIGEVTGRGHSMFLPDIEANRQVLRERIKGSRVLAIGSAGTIGASFVKALLPFEPAKVVVVDTSENGLTELVRDLRSTDGLPLPPELITYPVSFADPVFGRLFGAHGPFDIVANFAAHKHVRSEKDIFSIEAMLENNVFRARDLLERLTHTPPRHFFCVSTDKAANPVNIMGASKKIMEDLIMAYRDLLPVTTARFANVAFSNGSLPQGFLERLMKGQPLSAPLDVRRYFVSPEESGQICMLACMLGRSGDIFFPRLSEDVDVRRFSDIACDLLKTLGLEAEQHDSEASARRAAAAFRPGDRKYPVYFFTSDTTGEKPVEEFVAEGEVADFDEFAALGVIHTRPGRTRQEIEGLITQVRGYLAAGGEVTKEGVVQRLDKYLGGFAHQETGKNLDHRM
ncbi:MAG: polysaccharide biosynthesis protein [Lautropia sp.]|nr:polysaccharide biosynthesis protein [Lautropia sp.]